MGNESEVVGGGEITANSPTGFMFAIDRVLGREVGLGIVGESTFPGDGEGRRDAGVKGLLGRMVDGVGPYDLAIGIEEEDFGTLESLEDGGIGAIVDDDVFDG